MSLILKEEIDKFNNKITSEIPFGYGINAVWINYLQPIKQIVKDYKSDMPMVVICSVPAKLPARIEDYSFLQIQFFEAVEIMREYDCNILSTASKIQFKDQCPDGYYIMEAKGIWNSRKYDNYGRFWHEVDSNNLRIAGSRNPHRVVNAIKEKIKMENKITFVLLPGSLRIGDSISSLILSSNDFGKVYAIDTESPIDTIRKNALSCLGRNTEEYIYISGMKLVNINPMGIRKILQKKSIVVICVYEGYNNDNSTSIIENVLNKFKGILPKNHRIVITYPGEEDGILLKFKNLEALELKSKIHYTIIFDQLIINDIENNKNTSGVRNDSEISDHYLYV